MTELANELNKLPNGEGELRSANDDVAADVRQQNWHISWQNGRLRLSAGRGMQDPEKAVLPTIIYVNTNHEAFGDLRSKGFVVAVGWWDYSIKVGYFAAMKHVMITETCKELNKTDKEPEPVKPSVAAGVRFSEDRKMKNILIELGDEELKLVSQKELDEIIKSDEEFDGFHGWTLKGRLATNDNTAELKTKIKDANQFIIDIASLLGMDVDGIGFDGLSWTIDDFDDAIMKEKGIVKPC